MRFEFSAGGIVYKKEGNKTLILIAQHSQHHGWVFPKGLIGDHPSADSAGSLQASSGQVKKEAKEQAALREVKEETGIEAKIVKPLTPATYWYVFKNEKIKKTVYYFLMEFVGGDTKDHDFEMEKVEWVQIDKVYEKLTYNSDKKVWQSAKKLIE